jgi:hypothetical protein
VWKSKQDRAQTARVQILFSLLELAMATHLEDLCWWKLAALKATAEGRVQSLSRLVLAPQEPATVALSPCQEARPLRAMAVDSHSLAGPV